MIVSHRSIDRRTVLLGGLAAISTAASFRSVAAQDDADTTESAPKRSQAELRELFAQYGYLWSATSPATHQGDTFTLALTNRGDSALKLLPRVTIMDHMNHYNLPVIEEELELGAGQTRELMASNDYGVANHFSTNMLVSTGDASLLGATVTIRDAAGEETASFNERALWIKSRDDLEEMTESKEETEESGASHHDHVPAGED